MVIPSDEAVPEQNLVITGFMAVGKSTIGRRAADVLGRTFVDTDDLIRARTGKSIPQIFAEDGEVYFRGLEAEIARELAARTHLVIATGGGMLVNEANRVILSSTGFVVCLDAPPELIRERLARSADRPLAENWLELYEKRRTAYAAIPTHVNVGGKSVDVVVREIIALWRQVSK